MANAMDDERWADEMVNAGEYELAGIEVIARGVCVIDGKLLLCRAKRGATTYLPGGHVEFGETGRQALVREIREELGVEAGTGAFLGVVENSFLQHGKPHAEINLVYELRLDPDSAVRDAPRAQEDWIEFEWRPLADLGDLLPEAFRKLGENPAARFEP